MRIDLWDGGEEIATWEIDQSSEHPLEGLMLEGAAAFARAVITKNEEANANIGRASDAESHVFDEDDRIVYAVINHEQVADADYPVEVIR